MKTLMKPAYAETEEKASRFLCEIVPYAQFEMRLDELRKLHPKANHHVTAIRYLDGGQLFERGRDDGEPSGTSGIPSLRALQGADIVNVGAIVTRYFGGTKLGTGGLARAYAAAVNAALHNATLIPYVEEQEFSCSLPFSRAEKVENFLARHRNINVSRDYTAGGVVFNLHAPKDLIDELKDILNTY